MSPRIVGTRLLWIAAATVAIALAAWPIAAAAASSKTVNLEAAAYSPKTVSVPVGTTVVFKNVSAFPHTATADNGSFDTGMIPAGSSKSIKVSKAGTFPFHCEFHGGAGGVGQSGTITVTAAPAGNAAPGRSHPATVRPPASDTVTNAGGMGQGIALYAFAIAAIGAVIVAVLADLLGGRRARARSNS